MSYLVHVGVKGMKWKNHKFLNKINGEYIYAEDNNNSSSYTRDAIKTDVKQMKDSGMSKAEIKSEIKSKLTNNNVYSTSKNYSDSAKESANKYSSGSNSTSSSTKKDYSSEVEAARKKGAEEAAKKEKEVAENAEKRRIEREKQKAEEKANKEAAAAEAKAKAEKEEAEKAAKKSAKGKKSSGKKSASSKKTDKEEKDDDIQKKIDEAVKKALSEHGISVDTANEKDISDNQLDQLADMVIKGELGTGSKRKELLGVNYQKVQQLVNNKLRSKAMKTTKVSNTSGGNSKNSTKSVKYGSDEYYKQNGLNINTKKAKHSDMNDEFLEHHGILGQRWGIRRYQNKDGTLTPAGVKHYTDKYGNLNKKGRKLLDETKKRQHEEQAKKDKATLSSLKTLSDEDLAKFTNRLKAEKSAYEAYSDLSPVKKSVKNSIIKVGSKAVGEAAVGTLSYLGKKSVEKYFKDKAGDMNDPDYEKRLKDFLEEGRVAASYIFPNPNRKDK